MQLANAFFVLTIACSARQVRAHVAAWHKGMYCFNGTQPGFVNQNANEAVQPLFNLTRDEWWFHHKNNCDQFPPAPGDFLELPAGGTFTVEHAVNRAYTSLSYNGAGANEFLDGQPLPKLAENVELPCISSPNIHTQNESMAAGTAFAISYQSDITKVTEENLVVFTVLYNTPWRRIATYSVPASMPACPAEGCICAWGWVPNGCGEPNMYMLPYRCRVTGATSTIPLAPAKPAGWCEDDFSKCTPGAKQMIYWNQFEGNNIEVSGLDLSGHVRSPAYNVKLGFPNGAQNDIFLTGAAASSAASSAPRPTSTTPTSTPTSSSRPQDNSASRAGQLSHPALHYATLCFIFITLRLL
ncbi:hypothetical protein HGRIS_006150 [Hohenbuehelia grisea]|uniref:Uncharacterized protein n=1 Tax=Hohenbuehelia grisea TaxID=104357 RepID=A0ABR3K153_9AGAR